MTVPAVGDLAPDFELATDDGGSVSGAALRGRRYVLYFYPKDNTEACTLEAVDFTASAAEFAALDVAVIGVSPDSVRVHRGFRAKHGLGIVLAADPDHAAAEAFGVWQEKQMYGRRYMGIVRSTFLIGADGRVEAAWHPVRVPGHVAAVLAAARGSGA